jgi:hypothetical protein
VSQPKWDAERASEAGRLSGLARRRKATMNPQERALDAISKGLGELTKELLDAAMGRGDFAALDPKTRVSALMRVLEYGLGKPTVDSKAPPTLSKDDEPSTPTPDELFG